jgi:hypothetical protein
MYKGRYDKRYDPGDFYEVAVVHTASTEQSGILSPKPVYVADKTIFVKPAPMTREVAEDNTQVNEKRVKIITRSWIDINPKVSKCMYQGTLYDIKSVETLVHKRHLLIELTIKI